MIILGNEFMVDLETMGTQVGSVILSVGAVSFDHEGINGKFYDKISKEAMLNHGFTQSQYTLDWWDTQNEEARTEAFSGTSEPDKVMRDLANFVENNQAGNRVWSHGSVFDIAMCEHAFNHYGIDVPWKFWAVRDTRTIYDLSGIQPDRSKGTHHNALDDAVNQAEAVIKSVEELGGYRHD